MKRPFTHKIKLMLITHDLAIGGLQQVILNLCKTIDRDKFDVSVLCLRALGEYVKDIEDLGIRVLFISKNENDIDYFLFFKVAKLLKQERIDVIHTHNTQPLLDGTMGGLLAGVKTIIHTDHARVFPDKIRYMFAEWLCSQFVHKMVAVSEQTANNLKKYEKISSRKIAIIPNGIDGDSFNISIDKYAKRKELGINENGPIIGVCARLSEVKGLTYLLRAMPSVIKAFPEITLVIAGTGPMENDLKQEAAELKILSNVRFLGPRKDTPELFRLFDCYVLSSLSEGLPMVLLEAMASGCPVIATDVGGIPAVVKSYETGMLVKPQQSDQLARAIAEMLSSNELRNKISQKCLSIFKEKFDARIMTREYEKLYLQKYWNNSEYP